jgi:hypothetical protein
MHANPPVQNNGHEAGPAGPARGDLEAAFQTFKVLPQFFLRMIATLSRC